MAGIVKSASIPAFKPSSKVHLPHPIPPHPHPQPFTPSLISAMVLHMTLHVTAPQAIITDESVKKPVEEELSSDVLEICTADLEKLVSTASTTQGTSLCETCDGHVIVM